MRWCWGPCVLDSMGCVLRRCIARLVGVQGRGGHASPMVCRRECESAVGVKSAQWRSSAQESTPRGDRRSRIASAQAISAGCQWKLCCREALQVLAVAQYDQAAAAWRSVVGEAH